MIARLRGPGITVSEVQQRGQVAVGANDHVSSLASIAANGAAEWRELLSSERRDAGPAVAGADANDDAIDEHLCGRS